MKIHGNPRCLQKTKQIIFVYNMNSKQLILYSMACIVLLALIIQWGISLTRNCACVKEGLTEFEEYSFKANPYPSDAVINYSELNSPQYSHTVSLPFNSPYSCKNFCGPKAQCAITWEQCTADIDCAGCNPGPTPLSPASTAELEPYDDGGKLGQNQGLQYSSLTTGYDDHGIDFDEAYPGSKTAEIQNPYQGLDIWTNSFNKGLNLYNKRQEVKDQYMTPASVPSSQITAPKYPMTISTTGQFYQTLPPASNSYLM